MLQIKSDNSKGASLHSPPTCDFGMHSLSRIVHAWADTREKNRIHGLGGGKIEKVEFDAFVLRNREIIWQI